MIIKGSEIFGLNILTFRSGREVDKVKDIVFDPMENKVVALLIDEGGWFSDAKVILFEDIKSIGKDAVMIESRDSIQKAGQIQKRIANIAKGDKYLTKTKLVTEDGNDLGHIDDIFFDTNTGVVQRVQVSQGGFQNLKGGKKYVEVSDIVTVGEDVTIVKKYTEEMFESQGQDAGVQGALSGAVDKTKEIAGNVKDKLTEAAEVASEKADEFAIRAQNKASEIKNDPRVQEGLEKLSEQANKMKDKAGDVTENLKTKAEDLREDVKDSNADEKLKQKASDAKAKTAEYVDKAKSEVEDIKEENQNRLEGNSFGDKVRSKLKILAEDTNEAADGLEKSLNRQPYTHSHVHTHRKTNKKVFDKGNHIEHINTKGQPNKSSQSVI